MQIFCWSINLPKKMKKSGIKSSPYSEVNNSCIVKYVKEIY